MKIEVDIKGKKYKADLSRGIDVSIPLSPQGPRAWYVEPLKIEPVRSDSFTGSITEGGSVNFRNIFFNPHGHGTHTETVGHIEKEIISINQTLKTFFFYAKLISIKPETLENKESEFRKEGDEIITKNQIELALGDFDGEAVLLRTLPNSKEKCNAIYSDTNPPYLESESLTFLRDKGIKHFLLDLPSVDREFDGGKLEAHRAFWLGGRSNDFECTITEMIYVSNDIEDGEYLLNLQIAPFENDATPSKPVLFKLD